MLLGVKISSKNNLFCSSFTANFTLYFDYTYNGKEKDYESGFHYYGSRYYSSELSIWNSTDPMSDKYPSLTPYNYCANNPVKLIDPNGMEFDPASESKYVKPYEEEVKTRMLFIDNLRGTNKWNDDYNAQYTEYSNILDEISNLRNDKNNLYKIQNGINLGKGTNGLVSYGGNEDNMNIINISLSSKSDNINLFMGTLAHELKHAYQFYRGELGFVVENGVQINSSNSKKLEREAFVRGDMFSGKTMLNNGLFNLDHNLNFDNYVLPNAYDNIQPTINEDEFRYAFRGKKVIYNQK